ncbi:hypothetical protein KC332_g14281 [Hortaea werneckii]|uniref:Uncharacterized protein n=1 Tax=Hortaea werneckii TaxID=91943 RepID=A0A3M7IX65_HORWE|nr:hypothetical protein KC358_g11994 [Hortaea werneckii]KAI6813686.1 hypothetical protein KC350_g11515 [Hortaea werneckii]KAI6915472.1 hypothetical protein KC348_g12017 [Hortaea werneckii]KAI6928427.1 hypothetical protein KC341_g11535 [Hortaea werneckii]KAI6962425.1 hypothetical protein KC321_g11766 [Hortaea werneckii]
MPSPAALSPNSQASSTMGAPPPIQSNTGNARPPLTKRHSSASSSGVPRHHLTSPSSAGEHQQHPLRHPVGGRHAGGHQRHHHAKIVLPRNHSSARNLAKMGRAHTSHGVSQQQQQQTEDGRRPHMRQRSHHEGDTEIRLPGSLDESRERRERPAIRRNMTVTELPRTKSATKLKKNYSHGQLTRLQSGRNLTTLNSMSNKPPPSPGLKGKTKRPKSSDQVPQEKDLHQQEVELYQQQLAQKQRAQSQQPAKKVGFAVGSAGDTSDDEGPDMEGSELQEDEWTDQSNSASPYSTRQNTANNSRRPSTAQEKAPDKPGLLHPFAPMTNRPATETRQSPQADADMQRQRPEGKAEEVEVESTQASQKLGRPMQDFGTMENPAAEMRSTPSGFLPVETASPQPAMPPSDPSQPPPHTVTQEKPPQIHSPAPSVKDRPNPAAKRLNSNSLPAPALVSNVSALDSMHSSVRGSPASSIRGLDGSQDDGGGEGELVSRFIPSTSHPDHSTASGANTGAANNTPKQYSFHTPTERSENPLDRARMAVSNNGQFSVGSHPGPVSPGSTISGSSGAATPSLGRSRIELRMLHDKALADREAAAERQPLVPHHIYDRRNETLKSYLSLASLAGDGRGGVIPTAGLSMGPEVFQGRFKAVNTELRVVQKFRDPIAEAVGRLKACQGTKLSAKQQTSPQKKVEGLKASKSAVSLPTRQNNRRDGNKFSTSASPPAGPKRAETDTRTFANAGKAQIPSAKSAVQIQGATNDPRRHPRRGVSFAGTPPETREAERDRVVSREGEVVGRAPEAIARSMWDSLLT